MNDILGHYSYSLSSFFLRELHTSWLFPVADTYTHAYAFYHCIAQPHATHNTHVYSSLFVNGVIKRTHGFVSSFLDVVMGPTHRTQRLIYFSFFVCVCVCVCLCVCSICCKGMDGWWMCSMSSFHCFLVLNLIHFRLPLAFEAKRRYSEACWRAGSESEEASNKLSND